MHIVHILCVNVPGCRAHDTPRPSTPGPAWLLARTRVHTRSPAARPMAQAHHRHRSFVGSRLPVFFRSCCRRWRSAFSSCRRSLCRSSRRYTLSVHVPALAGCRRWRAAALEAVRSVSAPICCVLVCWICGICSMSVQWVGSVGSAGWAASGWTLRALGSAIGSAMGSAMSSAMASGMASGWSRGRFIREG